MPVICPILKETQQDLIRRLRARKQELKEALARAWSKPVGIMQFEIPRMIEVDSPYKVEIRIYYTQEELGSREITKKMQEDAAAALSLVMRKIIPLGQVSIWTVPRHEAKFIAGGKLDDLVDRWISHNT